MSAPVRESGLPERGGVGSPPPRRKRLELVGALLLVTVLWWPAACWRLGAAPFYTKGEPREALVVWEMVHGRGWILPRRNGTEIPSKPPMFHWLGAMVAKMAGTLDEGTVRVPSAVASLLGLYGVVLAGARWWSVRAGLFAALVLSTSFEWARAATNARVDMVLTLGLQAAFLSLFFFWQTRRRAWLLPLYGGIALAVLAKGPVGLALPAIAGSILMLLTFRTEAWRARRWREIVDWSAIRSFSLVRGLLFVALVAGAWYVLALAEGGWAFFRKQILAENVFTFVDDPDWGGGHRHGLLYLPAQWFLGSLPWSLLWPLVAADLWGRRHQLRRWDAPVLLLVWIGVVFVFYEFAASKRGVYLLALYPAVALLCGWFWSRLSEGEGEIPDWYRVAIRYAALGVSIAMTLALALVWVLSFEPPVALLVPERWEAEGLPVAVAVAKHLANGIAALAIASCAVLWFWTARSCQARSASRTLGALFLASWLSVVVGRAVVLPAYAEAVTLRPWMQAARVVTAGAPVYFFRTFDYQAVYYFGGHIPSVSEGNLPSEQKFLLVDRRTWERGDHGLEQAYEEVPLQGTASTIPQRLVLLRRKAE